MTASLQKILPSAEITGRLLRLATPIIAITISRMLMGFTDFVMVSSLGTDAQAAISPATLFVFTLLCFAFGLSTAIQAFAAQANGRGEPREAAAYAWQALYVGAALGVVVVIFTPLVDDFVRWVGTIANHSPEVRRLEVEYITIALWAFLPAALCSGFHGFFYGVERPYIGLTSMIISVLVNIGCNYVLIYGHLGFPALGVQGAAIGTVIAWWVRALTLAFFFMAGPFDEIFHTRRAFAYSWPKIRGVIRVGLPGSVQMITEVSAWTVFMVGIIPRFGTTAMAATNITVQYMELSFMPAVGVGFALSTLVGFSIGQRDLERTHEVTRAALFIAGAYMASMGLLFFTCRYPLMRLLSDDPEVIAIGASVMIWAAGVQIFDAGNIIYTSALRGAGDTRWPAVVIMLSSYGVLNGGGFLLAYGVPSLGVHGPWSMGVLYLVIIAVVMSLRFYSRAWRNIDLFAERDGAAGATTAEADEEEASSALGGAKAGVR